jgi:hypothetical protein
MRAASFCSKSISLIGPEAEVSAFTAWSSFAQAVAMSYQAFRNLVARGELIVSAVLVVIGVALIVLGSGKAIR